MCVYRGLLHDRDKVVIIPLKGVCVSAYKNKSFVKAEFVMHCLLVKSAKCNSHTHFSGLASLSLFYSRSY